MSPVKSKTEYIVTCDKDGCKNRFRKVFESRKDANAAASKHTRFHDVFKSDSRVTVPVFLRSSSPREPGRISFIWFLWEEVVVTLDRKGDCYECIHPHKEARSWRGSLELLEVE